jgi:beta-lactamase class A
MLLRFGFPILCLLVVAGLCRADDPPTLRDKLVALARAHKGKAAFALKHLRTGEMMDYHADEVMPTASLIKFPIMCEVYEQTLEGKVKLGDMVALREQDKVPGSGILTYHFSEGASFPLKDAVRLMIAYSDNTATNLVLDRIGIGSTNKRMADWGFSETRVNAKVFLGSKTSVDPERTKKYGLGSTTARDMVRLLEKVYCNQAATPEYCQAMIGHLKKCEDKNMFPRLLPAGVVIAHKTGAVSNVRTDAGIIYVKSGAVALCVLTSENEDQRWTRDNAAEILIATIAREVHEHFSKSEKEPEEAGSNRQARDGK